MEGILNAIWECLKPLHYGLWKLILMLPAFPRILLEVTLCIGIALIVLFLVRFPLWLVLKILHICNILFLGRARYMCCVLMKSHPNVYAWDDGIGSLGRRIERFLHKKSELLIQKKLKFFLKDILKKRRFWIPSALIYVWACLPWLHLERYLDELSLSPLYFGNKTIMAWEASLTKGMEDYPDLLKLEEEPTSEAETSEAEVQEPVYLVLRDDVTYANVREVPDLSGKEICTVSKKDFIVYQNIYSHDNKRYWLKVVICSQNDKEGWISEKVIAQEILDKLELE